MNGLSQSTMIYISKKERNSSVTPVMLTTRVCTESRIILEALDAKKMGFSKLRERIMLWLH